MVGGAIAQCNWSKSANVCKLCQQIILMQICSYLTTAGGAIGQSCFSVQWPSAWWLLVGKVCKHLHCSGLLVGGAIVLSCFTQRANVHKYKLRYKYKYCWGWCYRSKLLHLECNLFAFGANSQTVWQSKTSFKWKWSRNLKVQMFANFAIQQIIIMQRVT